MGNQSSRPHSQTQGHPRHHHLTPSAPASNASSASRITRRNSSSTTTPHEPRLPPQIVRRESHTPGIGHHQYSIPPTREELEDGTLRQFPYPPTAVEPAVSFGNIDFGGGNASEMSTPGIEPQAFSQPFAPPMIEKIENPKPRKSSLDSTISMGENDMPNSRDERAIPTQVQWKEGGEKVYVTGTFCSWEKKYRLMKHDGGIMSAIIPIPPGTHHVKFIVDGEMRTSSTLPTAVDDTGILVNYLEVSADDMPPPHRAPSREDFEDGSHHVDVTQIFPAESAKRYTTVMPPGLQEYMDNGGEELDDAPPPPSLPMMLQKVILNTSTQSKDDASVLTTPNHAVLNHLATSSVKNNILAVSATTRYKKKYVTTILYKAATGGGGA